jgi:hypothetical protein
VSFRPAISRFHSGAVRWSALAFLIVFTLLLIAVTSYVLVPGFEAIRDPQLSPDEKQRLVAWYRLLLAVLLFILIAGLALTFRFGRLFFPRPTPPRTTTRYTDAWAESGRRAQIPPADDDDDNASDDPHNA